MFTTYVVLLSRYLRIDVYDEEKKLRCIYSAVVLYVFVS